MVPFFIWIRIEPSILDAIGTFWCSYISISLSQLESGCLGLVIVHILIFPSNILMIYYKCRQKSSRVSFLCADLNSNSQLLLWFVLTWIWRSKLRWNINSRGNIFISVEQTIETKKSSGKIILITYNKC